MVGFFVYFASFSYLSILRFTSFNAEYYDLGIMTQVVHNSSLGRIFTMTLPETVINATRGAVHLDPLILIITPFYKIFPSPITLLIIQTAFLAVGGILIFLIARKLGLNDKWSILVSYSWWLYPPIMWSNMYDFHAVVLGGVLMLGVVLADLSGKRKIGMLLSLLVIISKEQAGLVVGMYYFFTWWQMGVKKKENFSLMLWSMIAFTYALGAMFVMIPYLRGGNHFALERYHYSKEPIMFLSQIFSSVFNLTSVETGLVMLLGGGWIGLVGWVWMFPALPDLAINLLSQAEGMKGIYHHYSALTTPFVFLSIIFGLKSILAKKIASKELLATIFIIGISLNTLLFSPLPYSKKVDVNLLNRRLSKSSINLLKNWQRLLESDEISLSVTNRLAPHFAGRKALSRFPAGSEGRAEYVMILKSDINSEWLEPAKSVGAYLRLHNDKIYSKISENEELELWKLN